MISALNTPSDNKYMDNNKREDDFNAWVRREGCKTMHLNLSHATNEECWVSIIQHSDPEIKCEDKDKIIDFLNRGNKEGYTNRYWFEDLHDDYQHKIIGERIAFCYNG